MSELTDKIAENATAPAEVQVDGQRVRQQSLREQIEADKYVRSTSAAKRRLAGLRLTRSVPPGAA
jgi:hypothetical protein